jgi:hypothetical protein
MAIGERFRSGGTRGIARFLADHQHCDAGFDVRRQDEPGSGKLKITCLGCGQSVSYRAGEANGIAAAGLDFGGTNGLTHGGISRLEPEAAPEVVAAPSGPRRAGSAGPDAPTARGTARRARRPKPAPKPAAPPAAAPEGRHGVRGWLPVGLIALLIAAGLTMIAIGLFRSGDDGDQSPATPAAQPAPAPEAPAPAPAPEEPSTPAPAPKPQAANPSALDRQVVAGRFAIGLPPGWNESGGASEGYAFEPRGGAAGVTVFFEEGARPLGELASGAQQFLADAHSGANVGAPTAVRFGGGPARQVSATYGGGEEVAFVLARRGYSYLVLRRVDRGASTAQAADAEAVAVSFRPR